MPFEPVAAGTLTEDNEIDIVSHECHTKSTHRMTAPAAPASQLRWLSFGPAISTCISAELCLSHLLPGGAIAFSALGGS